MHVHALPLKNASEFDLDQHRRVIFFKSAMHSRTIATRFSFMSETVPSVQNRGRHRVSPAVARWNQEGPEYSQYADRIKHRPKTPFYLKQGKVSAEVVIVFFTCTMKMGTEYHFLHFSKSTLSTGVCDLSDIEVHSTYLHWSYGIALL